MQIKAPAAGRNCRGLRRFGAGAMLKVRPNNVVRILPPPTLCVNQTHVPFWHNQGRRPRRESLGTPPVVAPQKSTALILNKSLALSAPDNERHDVRRAKLPGRRSKRNRTLARKGWGTLSTQAERLPALGVMGKRGVVHANKLGVCK